MRPMRLEHAFVEEIPEVVQPGVCYVTLKYATAAHLCPCGCGGEVFTPLNPADWAITFDGETVSLHPSVSNRVCPKRSHYWIKRNRIEWARPTAAKPLRRSPRYLGSVTQWAKRRIKPIARRRLSKDD